MNNHFLRLTFSFTLWLPLRVFEVFVLTPRSLRSLGKHSNTHQPLTPSQDNVTETFLQFMVLDDENEKESDNATAIENNNGNRRRPQMKDEPTEEMIRSYRVCMLLTPADDLNNHLRVFLTEQAETITRSLLKCFTEKSRANLHHVCRVLSKMLEHPEMSDKILHIIGRNNEAVNRCIAPLLDYIEYRPVAELLINLGSFEEVNTSNQTVRWKFVQALSSFKLFGKLCSIVSSHSSPVSASSAAAEVIIELTEKLCLDDNGEILFTPFGYTPELIDR